MESRAGPCHTPAPMSTPHRAAPPPINWPTVLFLAGTSIAAAAWPFFAWHYGVTATEIALTVGYYVATGLAITVGYHRLLAHRTFKAHPAAEAVFLLFGAAAWQGSALEWSVDHIQHHSHIDTEADPYNRKRGFWYSHIGWLIRRETGTQLGRIPHFLKNDPLVMLQHRYYVPIAVAMSFLVPMAICGWRGLLLVGAVRIVALHHTTWFINSWAHTGKRRPFNPDVTANDNWFLALFTFGEGFHNYHHAFPNDYRNGIRAFDWDPSKWLIWTMSKLGIAYDLKRVSPAAMWRRRVETLLAYQGSASTRAELLQSTRESLERVAQRSEQKLAALSARLHGQAAASQADLADIRRRLAERVEEWKKARDLRSLARARRAEELVEQLTLYRELLERLSAAPSLHAR
jgi:stearoyl-CoA desaturase (delta-9 desaturase)